MKSRRKASETTSFTSQGLVFISHGFAEHLDWYSELAGRMVSSGLLAFGHDHAGHGQSGGKRAIVHDIDDYANDVFMHATKVGATSAQC